MWLPFQMSGPAPYVSYAIMIDIVSIAGRAGNRLSISAFSGRKPNKPRTPLHGNDLNGTFRWLCVMLWNCWETLDFARYLQEVGNVTHRFICFCSGAGRGLLEVVEGDLLPQRDFLHHDREAEELAAEGVRGCQHLPAPDSMMTLQHFSPICTCEHLSAG